MKKLVQIGIGFWLAMGFVACTKDHLPKTHRSITPSDIYTHIAYLASDELHGRAAGSEDELKAAHYIRSFFKKYQLKPAGKDGTYLYPFDIIAGVKLGTGNTLSLHTADNSLTYQVEKDFLPLAFSDNGTFEGEVVFAGYGINAPDLNYNDYHRLDVKDKIILVLRFTPEGDNPHSKFYNFAALRRKALEAREKGAGAILFVTGPKNADENELVKLRYDNSVARSGIGAASISREVANRLLQASGKDLTELQNAIDDTKKPHSFKLPGVRVRLAVDVQEIHKTAHNVAGILEGNDPDLKDEFVIVGAHFDHLGLGGSNSLAPEAFGQIHNGADDNASGTAGVLELVEKLSAEREKLKRPVLFLSFSAEELGLLGSKAYVEHPPVPLDHAVAMINMDMIGRMKNNKLIVQGTGTSPIWESLVDSLNQDPAFDFELKLGKEGIGPSDHTSFYQKGIPVLFFFTGIHEDYHKPSDDVEKINKTGEARVVKFVYQVVKTLDGLPARPQFTKVSEPERRQTRRGFRVYLGTIPDYAETDVKGLKLSGVRKGGPAEKVGLKAGDVIIKFGDREINNIYDYTYALQDYKPGDQVEIVVMRGQQKLTFHLELQGRKR